MRQIRRLAPTMSATPVVQEELLHYLQNVA